ncbi:YccF domain-containing protein [Saccharicrinis sp. FJH54]|uniref:YccF domain-containing protein n=1 Tax=Saccharicrinis sp. FJH54 TaxID=3344665 RepID=UPI0035D48207
MRFLGNIIWLVFGGFAVALEYFVSGIALMVTIIGIPFGIQSIKLGMFALWPFNQKIQDRPEPDGCITIPMNIIWFIIGGFWILVTHILFGTLLFITIIGIPWGQQHFKMARLAFAPFGKDVVYKY